MKTSFGEILLFFILGFLLCSVLVGRSKDNVWIQNKKGGTLYVEYNDKMYVLTEPRTIENIKSNQAQIINSLYKYFVGPLPDGE